MLPVENNKEELIKMATELKSSKALNERLMDAFPYPAMLILRDKKIVVANRQARDLGVEVGTYCWDTFGKRASISEQHKENFEKNETIPSQGINCIFCKAKEALASMRPINEKISAGDTTYDTYWVPLTADVYLHYAIVL